MKDNLMTYLGFAVVFFLVTTKGPELGRAIKNFAKGTADIVGGVVG